MEQVWDISDKDDFDRKTEACKRFYEFGRFYSVRLSRDAAREPSRYFPPWDHLIYAYVLEATRAVQILERVVREYRRGEALGIPSQATRRWVEATEVLLFGAANPLSAWLSTSNVQPNAEDIRRMAFHRLFGLELPFGRSDNTPAQFHKAPAANTGFTALFEELLFELWQAISNLNNKSGVNQSDDDRIFRITEQLRFILTSRRQFDMLRREELSAVTALGWCDLTLAFDSPVVRDLGAGATNPGDRLKIIGEKVGLPAHTRSPAFFSMAAEISILLRAIEAGFVSGPDKAWLLYATEPKTPGDNNGPFGSESRRVITEWAAATGKNLKERSRPVDIRTAPRLVAVR
jgi:hypothetical protein